MSRTSSGTRAARHHLPTRSRLRSHRRPPSPAQDVITCVIDVELIDSGIEPTSRVAHVSRRIHPGYAVPIGRRLDAAPDRPKTSRRLRRRLEVVETAIFTVERSFKPDDPPDRTSLYDLLDTADHGETTDITTQIEAISAVETAGARPRPGARAGGVDGCSIMR